MTSAMFEDTKGLVWFMVFNANFNNISVISWQSFLWVEKTTNASHRQTISHNVVLSTPHHKRDLNTQL
jgi:hypothetical protein